MLTVAQIIAGSRLFGMEGPNSDTDIKSIHLPSLRDCILGRPQDTISTKGGKTESESFSLSRFLQLASNGEDLAMQILHAPKDKRLVDSGVYEQLRLTRHRFYTRQMSGSLKFARSMAAKYNMRSDRMDITKTVLDILIATKREGGMRVRDCWDSLPESIHTSKGIAEHNTSTDKRFFLLCGRQLQATANLDAAIETAQILYDSYGSRVRQATALDGRDMKSISHSFRVGYQLKAIYTKGDFTYPLEETPFLRAIKFYQISYINDGLDEKLNNLITEVEELAAKSTLPDKVDQTWCDQFVLDVYHNHYKLPLGIYFSSPKS